MSPEFVQIPVVGAWSEGVTPIVAFDAALLKCGIGDVNLVSLSSIIPPAHEPVLVHALGTTDQPEFGDLTFAVMAEQRASSGAVASGLAWVNTPDRSGGLFLEGHGPDPDVVRSELLDGMNSMIAARPQMQLDAEDIVVHVVAGPDTDQPSCALVIAVFEHRPFNAAA